MWVCGCHHVRSGTGGLLRASALLLSHFVGGFSPGSGMLLFRPPGYLACLLLADAPASPCKGVEITDAGHYTRIFTWSLGLNSGHQAYVVNTFACWDISLFFVLFLSSLNSEWLFKSSSFTCSDYSQEDKSNYY